MKLLGHLEESLRAFFAGSPEAAAPPPSEAAPVHPVASELDESVSVLETLARELIRQRELEEPSTASLLGARQDPERVARAASEQQEKIAADIVALHEKLGTGLTRSDLDKLQTGLNSLLPYLEKEQGGVVQRAYFHVLSRVLRESGKLAWQELLQRMESASVRWPEPGGLSSTATPEERESARSRSLETAGENFLLAGPEHICDRVFGVVRIWRASYPPQGSDLWLQQCLLGVASGRQLELFEKGAEILMGPEGEEVKAQLRQRAKDALEQTKATLQRGTKSLTDVNDVLIGTDRLCSQIAPDLVWGWLEPRLDLTRLSVR